MKSQWNLPRNEKTPFNALAEYDRLMGEQRRNANAWRTRFLFISLVNVLLVAATFWSFTQNKTVPVFILENSLGELKYLGSANDKMYGGGRVTDAMVQAQVRNFILNMYAVPLDAEVLKNNITNCYSMMTQEAANKFTKNLRENNPMEMFGLKSRTAKIESVLVLTSNTYQVDFIVTETNIDGGGKKQSRERAVVTTVLLEPDKSIVELNPAGIFIAGYDITNVI